MRISDWSSDVCSSDLACDGGSEGDRQVRESHRFPLPIWNRPSSGREIFAGRATARLFVAPAHQRGSEFRQENNRSEERRVGKECVSVDLGGRRIIKKKKTRIKSNLSKRIKNKR